MNKDGYRLVWAATIDTVRRIKFCVVIKKLRIAS